MRRAAVVENLRTGHTGAAVSLDAVSKTYGGGQHAVKALDAVNIDVSLGEFLCIVGASGCGKSTLLNLIAGLDSPTDRKSVV